MAQLDYNREPIVGIPGQISSLQNTTVKTRSNDVDIKFGRGVVAGATPGETVTLPSGAGDSFEGIAVFTHKMDINRNESFYEAKDAVSMLTVGTVWVESTVAVDYGDTVYLINTGDDAGKITNVVGTNTPTGAKVITGNTAAGLCEIELNLPYQAS